MEYEEALHHLYGFEPRGIHLGLSRIEAACAQRGHPERAVPVVHVAGTNGKGSTCAFIESILREAGYKTGLTTSPHIHTLTERVRIDGAPIAKARLAEKATALRVLVQKKELPELTFFEVMTLLAFELFSEEQCDIAIVEVGLGGRLDSTNVVVPEVSVITRIGIDHADRLGDTLTAIATEKAGIIKEGVPLVATPHHPDVAAVLRDRCKALSSSCSFESDVVEVESKGESLSWSSSSSSGSATQLGLAGGHQHENAGLAIRAALNLRSRGFTVPDDAMERGLSKATWPCRLELLEGAPSLLLDAAHNPQGAQVLAKHLGSLGEGQVRTLLFGCMADKDASAMLEALDPLFDEVIYVAPKLSRAARPETLATLYGGLPASSVAAGLEEAIDIVGPGGLVVGAGSIFVVAELRRIWLDVEADPPIRM